MATDVEHFDLSGRRALVLGADTPAGGAIARAFGEAGARVALGFDAGTERRAAAQALQKELGEPTPIFETGSPAAAGQAVVDATRALGRLDVLASCPELFLAKPIGQTSDDELRRVLDTNFVAQWSAARAAVEAMQRQGSGGNLILLSHVLGERGLTNTAAYGAAQAATQSLVRSLAQELGPERISINGISLGWMDWMSDRIDPDDEDAARAVRFTILKRAGSADDIGPLAVYLAGAGVGYVTGQVFNVDGGLLQHL